jgi:phospholipid/cholesterol/gamma-HCH transport system substrate-binding protein
MKRVYNNYFLVGLFTLIIGGISIVLLLNMSGNNKSSESYFSYFSNVTGLGYGNPVYYEGYRVGQVEEITPETISGQLLFRIDYSLIEGWKVPSDSITKIESSGLLSDMSLGIHAGTATSYLSPNQEIKGVMGDDIMATITNLANDFSALNEEKITPLFDLVYERVDTITKPLETQLPELLSSLDILIADVNKLINTADHFISEENVEGINNIVMNLNKLSEQLSAANGWLNTSVDNINQLIDSGNDLINNSDNQIKNLLDITIRMVDTFSTKANTIGNEIESASMNLNEATETIRKNPSNLIFKTKSKIADEDL